MVTWSCRLCVAAVCAAALLLLPRAAHGAPVERPSPPDSHAGLVATRGELHGDHPSVNGKSGYGMSLDFGTPIPFGLFLDLHLGGYPIDVGPTPEIYYPADRADAMTIEALLLYRSGEIGRSGWYPWIAAGPAYHYVTWDHYAYTLSGSGFDLGAGLDRPFHRYVCLRIGARYARFRTEADYLAPGRRDRLEEFAVHTGVLFRLPD